VRVFVDRRPNPAGRHGVHPNAVSGGLDAAGDVGSAFTRLVSAGGASVVAVDVERERLDGLAAELADGPGMVVTEVADIADHEAVRDVVARATQRFGRLDGCFNNIATSHEAAALPDSSLDLWEHVVRVNASGCFYVLKYVLGVMREQRSGAIVTTATTAGLRGWLPAGHAAYGTSQHAVVGLTFSAALEAANYNVRVNAISPAWVGPQSPDAPPVTDALPLKRLAEPHEVAAVAAFLLSDEARYITGETLRVDGGLLTGQAMPPAIGDTEM
jgi:NAD(P)-dependent dehydrogenase (short-subunit alcohol dehydrogenase family)